MNNTNEMITERTLARKVLERCERNLAEKPGNKELIGKVCRALVAYHKAERV